MTTSLSNAERAALALKAVEGLSDEALQKLVKEGGHLAKLAKAKTGVKELYGTVLRIGEGVESLGVWAMLAQAYMEERKAKHDRQQQRRPEVFRQPITATELYPAGFSMEKARAEFKGRLTAPAATEGATAEPVVEAVSPAAPTPPRRSRGP